MQLKRGISIRRTLTTATVALLGAQPLQAATGGSHSDLSLLVYNEQARTHARELVYSLSKQLKNGSTLGVGITYDGLTGASPTGASPSKYTQTLTRASGNETVLVEAGKLPTDNSFSETRFAADLSLTRPVTDATSLTGEAHLSKERDYSSVGLGFGIAQDVNEGNTTLGLFALVSHDVSSALGGTPIPFEESIPAGEGNDDDRNSTRGGLSKNVYDILASVTQVVNSKTLLRGSYSFDYAKGYLTDPYKVISIVQPIDSADPGEPVTNLYEKRPNNRFKHAVYGEIRRFISRRATIDFSYRFFRDSWGIQAHTVDGYIHLNLSKLGSLQPRVRYYTQSRADFSRPFLVQGEPLPQYASADARLAAFYAITYGATYSFGIGHGSRLNISTEYYTQRGDSSPPESFGPLLAFDLFPNLDAVMVRLGFSHDF